MECSVCGGKSFTSNRVLWPQLITEWQLSQVEVDYVDDQQGKHCDDCGANVRSIALANAIRAYFDSQSTLQNIHHSIQNEDFTILEINEAGTLTPTLATLGSYTFGAYPEVDMHALPYRDGEFDMVVHSDTLEHIENPAHALSECLRVLKPRGGLCFTVPTIVGRMTRNRAGIDHSFHGSPGETPEDFIVHTEFGADAWTYILEAGFTELSIHTADYPAGIAYLAKRPQS